MVKNLKRAKKLLEKEVVPLITTSSLRHMCSHLNTVSLLKSSGVTLVSLVL